MIAKPTAESSNVIRLDHYRHLEPGGLYWRRARGLLSLRDLADRYRETHYLREPGLLAPLPTDRLGRAGAR
jgi:hypothetical protein